MDTTKIDLINKLKKDIQELEHFLYTVVEYYPNSGRVDTKLFLTIEVSTSTKTSLRGSRRFGMDRTDVIKSEFTIPNEVRNNIRAIVEKSKDDLECKLNSLLT